MKSETINTQFENVDLSFLKQFIKQPIEKSDFLTIQNQPKVEVKSKEFSTTEKPKDWSEEIKELEIFFNTMTPPTEPIKLDPCTTITDCSKFIESHLEYVKANNGNNTFLPYLDRLRKLKNLF